jgi:predicted alpha/beta-fold hydrolase
VLVVHGLGSEARRPGPRRLAAVLRAAGFAVLRVDLRGAGDGRGLAGGSYAAQCNRDLAPLLLRARGLAGGRPLAAVGLSLGGTVLLNACLDPRLAPAAGRPVLDRLVCVSSPLDLAASSASIDRLRNLPYQRWLVRGLRCQTLADRRGLAAAERRLLAGAAKLRTVRGFDAAITAPRWGYASVDAYYAAASPLPRLGAAAPLPPTLLLHAADDPWVPAAASLSLAERPAAGRPPGLEVLVTATGGHNGFHAVDDPHDLPASWSDRLTARWLARELPPG